MLFHYVIPRSTLVEYRPLGSMSEFHKKLTEIELEVKDMDCLDHEKMWFRVAKKWEVRVIEKDKVQRIDDSPKMGRCVQ